MKKRVCIGILAHVDAGKTTLSEALLYQSGAIRKMGRVDHKDAFLDTSPLEKERGITIFSKQARFSYQEMEVILLDTPGHTDFSSEMERTLQVLDYAILIVSATDGVQGHTETLWKLLKQYQIPAFLFVNKMDLSGADKDKNLQQLQEKLSSACVDFSDSERDGKKLEVIAERKAMYIVNKKIPGGFASFDRATTIAKYSLNFDIKPNQNSDSGIGTAERYVILYPAPRAASLATTSHLILLGNGDELFDGIKICGLKYFIENVLSVDGTEPVRGNVAQNNF